jgi:hypothetical protein
VSTTLGDNVTDLKLFHVNAGSAQEAAAASVALEKSLQTLIEDNMEALFAVQFLATEYSTGKKHGAGSTRWGWTRTAARWVVYRGARSRRARSQGGDESPCSP